MHARRAESVSIWGCGDRHMNSICGCCDIKKPFMVTHLKVGGKREVLQLSGLFQFPMWVSRPMGLECSWLHCCWECMQSESIMHISHRERVKLILMFYRRIDHEKLISDVLLSGLLP